MKKYYCPKDGTNSSYMCKLYEGPIGIRNRTFPNEKLLCPICSRTYRWQDLKEVEIIYE